MQNFLECNNLGEVINGAVYTQPCGKKYYYAKLTLEAMLPTENPISREEALEFVQAIYNIGINIFVKFKNVHFENPLYFRSTVRVDGECTLKGVKMKGMDRIQETRTTDFEGILLKAKASAPKAP